MLTFQDQQNLYQQISGDYSAGGLTIAKRDINEGGAMFLNRLGRKFNKEYLTASLVANQQYYQFPSEVLRVSEVRIKVGPNFYTPELVASEEYWNRLNTITSTSTIPTHYYIKGFNEIGLFPVPSTDSTNALHISYEPQHIDLTASDYTAGTLAVTNNSTTITGTGTTFTAAMVGRYLQVTDGTDGKWYRIKTFTSATVIVLENFYEGPTGNGKNYRIGEVMKIPQGYQDAPVFYALDRFYQTQNDQKSASAYEIRFEKKVKSAKETYGKSTSRQGVKTNPQAASSTSMFTNLNAPIIYP